MNSPRKSSVIRAVIGLPRIEYGNPGVDWAYAGPGLRALGLFGFRAGALGSPETRRLLVTISRILFLKWMATVPFSFAVSDISIPSDSFGPLNLHCRSTRKPPPNRTYYGFYLFRCTSLPPIEASPVSALR